jgi:hypothetical protein
MQKLQAATVTKQNTGACQKQQRQSLHLYSDFISGVAHENSRG